MRLLILSASLLLGACGGASDSSSRTRQTNEAAPAVQPVPGEAAVPRRETGAKGDAPDRPAPASPAAISPCRMQGETRLSVAPMEARGTEPFWAARIEGRCVTYSHPEDQAGTRVWTRYAAGEKGGGTWSGALGGRLFELRLRAEPGCSDGMSDKVYPLAADLIVNGERRRGCAEPL
ncbi:MAG TPA: hypothetical protein VI381_04485 [Allosphingosinicella sp.]